LLLLALEIRPLKRWFPCHAAEVLRAALARCTGPVLRRAGRNISRPPPSESVQCLLPLKTGQVYNPNCSQRRRRLESVAAGMTERRAVVFRRMHGYETNSGPSVVPNQSQSKQLRREIKAWAVGVLNRAVRYKIRLLAALDETRRDPTLRKVALHLVDVALTHIARDLSAFGWSRDARYVLAIRDACKEATAIADALCVIDGAVKAVYKRFRVLPQASSPVAFPSLAEIRAHLLVLAICHESGKRLLKKKDIPRLLAKDPDALDRIYTAAMRLNRIRGYEAGVQPQNRSEHGQLDNTTARVFRCDERVWTLRFEGVTISVPKREAKGLAYIQQLLMRPDKVISVVTLFEAVSGDTRVRAAGSAGESHDHAYRLAMRKRYQEAIEEREEAKEVNDIGRQEKLDLEVSQIGQELVRAEGLGGRTRLVDDPVEKLRTSITNAINRAIKTISDMKHGRLAAHLDKAIHRGRDMSYTPQSPTDWEF